MPWYKKESPEDGKEGIIVILGSAWFPGLFLLILNLELNCHFDNVYSHLHYLSDISYVIINSIYVVKENVTCFTDFSYE